jgi:hypothetical protein
MAYKVQLLDSGESVKKAIVVLSIVALCILFSVWGRGDSILNNVKTSAQIANKIASKEHIPQIDFTPMDVDIGLIKPDVEGGPYCRISFKFSVKNYGGVIKTDITVFVDNKVAAQWLEQWFNAGQVRDYSGEYYTSEGYHTARIALSISDSTPEDNFYETQVFVYEVVGGMTGGPSWWHVQ